jgi:hypothetical protein
VPTLLVPDPAVPASRNRYGEVEGGGPGLGGATGLRTQARLPRGNSPYSSSMAKRGNVIEPQCFKQRPSRMVDLDSPPRSRSLTGTWIS